MAQIDKDMHQFLAEKLDENSVVVDIGAHTGWLSKGLCQDAGGDPSKFYLVEACPGNFAVLEKECPGYNLFNIAISDEPGEVVLYTARDENEPEGSSQSNSLFEGFIGNKEWNAGTVEIKAPATTLSAFCADNGLERIDLLKINCEGSEYKILSPGAPLDFLSRVRYLNLQLHGKEPVFLTPEMLESKLRINRRLLEHGFRIVMGDLTEHIPMISKHVKQLWARE